MFNTPVFVHTRNDIEPGDIWVLAGDFDSADRAFQHTIAPFKVTYPGLKRQNVQTPRALASEVNRVLISLMSDRCPVPCTCIILAHAPGNEYIDIDRQLVKSLSEDLKFALSEVVVYEIRDGQIRPEKQFSSYFFR